jgi:hypothetical protein
MNLRINEAIAQRSSEGKQTSRAELYALLWPKSRPSTQQVNFSNLANGRTKTITVDQILILCKVLECDPNYLTGYDKE